MDLSYARLRRVCARAALSGFALVMVACASTPADIAKVIAPPSYNELMLSAEEAAVKGGMAESLVFLEQAAKSDPAKKHPWLRTAQIQFDARNYGAAILAAQEVLQRDTVDTTAQSIMAASGLRVSARALEQLRAANALGGNTRDEAQSLARTMRDALGESILPAPASPPVEVAKPPSRPARRSAQAGTVASEGQSAAPLVPAKASPKAAPAEPKRNPFDALKG